MKAKPRQLDLALEEIESIRHLAGALERTVSDLAARIQPQSKDASHKIVMRHAKDALRSVRGLAMTPTMRAKIDGAYRMICNELEAA
jgi:hypothetical protein